MKTNNIKKIFNIRYMVLAVLMGVLLMTVVFSDTSYSLFVNGGAVNVKNGSPTVRKGTTFVPIKAIAEGMGDKYSWDDDWGIATITKKDGMVITIQTSKSTMHVNDKLMPIETKVVNGITVPVDVRPFRSQNVVYVPLSFIENHLEYPVTLKDLNGKTNIYIGKVPQTATPTPKPTGTPKPTEKAPNPTETPKPTQTPTPTPKPTQAPVKEGVAGSDLEKNVDWIVDNLEFQRTDTKTAMYNPRNQSVHGSIVDVGYDSREVFKTLIKIKAWDADEYTPEVAGVQPICKELFKFYFPTEGDKFYKLIDALYDGNRLNEMEKVIYFDDRPVWLQTQKGSLHLQILIGDTGRKIKLDKSKMDFVFID